MSDHPHPTDRIEDFKPWRAWVADDAGSVFPTFAAFEWFVRKHHDRLVDSGQFIPRRGPAGSLAGPHLGAVVLEILRDEARRAAA
ncbi:hypothetical protein [Halochromatium glycolicum]|uniref:Uncharacterized protein n=1 Tax=Halochromatium glycolicum TaxID=85075 RepID=A0AAJ0XAR2_9GAMM|nr:hypothetical protein [Halochromatium glycolicum]MBK1705112.1 hypothetical protein [Halochromatium glycolicum]